MSNFFTGSEKQRNNNPETIYFPCACRSVLNVSPFLCDGMTYFLLDMTHIVHLVTGLFIACHQLFLGSFA